MKILIIAASTTRQTLRQPILFAIVGLSAMMIFVSKFFTLFTFGQQEQLNMMREMGLATITMSGLLYTVFASALAITEDLERKSALTVLCKPVHRYEFILGKFFGISFTIVCVYVVLTVTLLFTLWIGQTQLVLKDDYLKAPGDLLSYCRFYAPPILKGVVLSYFEIILLNAISLALATRLPMLINLAVCSLVFIVGNLSNYLYTLLIRGFTNDVEKIASYSWFQLLSEYPAIAVARIFYVIIPNLESFNISSAVAYGIYVSPKYIMLTVSYGLVYTTIALLTALVSFEHLELM